MIYKNFETFNSPAPAVHFMMGGESFGLNCTFVLVDYLSDVDIVCTVVVVQIM